MTNLTIFQDLEPRNHLSFCLFITYTQSVANFFHLLFQHLFEFSLTLYSCYHVYPRYHHVRSSGSGVRCDEWGPIRLSQLCDNGQVMQLLLGPCLLTCEMEIIPPFMYIPQVIAKIK